MAMGHTMERQFVFWVTEQKKCLSFHPENGYRKVTVPSFQEMWDKVYHYIETEHYQVG